MSHDVPLKPRATSVPRERIVERTNDAKLIACCCGAMLTPVSLPGIAVYAAPGSANAVPALASPRRLTESHAAEIGPTLAPVRLRPLVATAPARELAARTTSLRTTPRHAVTGAAVAGSTQRSPSIRRR